MQERGAFSNSGKPSTPGAFAQTDCRVEMDSSSSNKQHKYLILAFNGPKCGVQWHVNESAK